MLLNIFQLNDILKNYLNIFQICNEYNNEFISLKSKEKPDEKINKETTLNLIREQVEIMKIYNKKIKLRHLRTKKIKNIELKLDVFNKGLKEIIEVEIYKKGIFKKKVICKAYNSNRAVWYKINIKNVYMFTLLYIKYLKLYIKEIKDGEIEEIQTEGL